MRKLVENLLGTSFTIGTLPISLQAMLICEVFRLKHKTIVWIVSSNDEMFQAKDDLGCFLDDQYIHMYLPRDIRPYQDDSTSKEATSQRIAVLYRLLKSEPLIVIAPFDSLVQYTIGLEDLSNCVIELGPNQNIDRDKLGARLVQMGYTRESLIDDVGQFSIRGSVMDIFSPGMSEPVRLDLFGDCIEEIKSMNLPTQRSKKSLVSAQILPASEVLLDRNHVKQARPKLKRIKDTDSAILIEDIEQGIYSPGIENYLSLFFSNPAQFMDYLPSNSILISPDDADLGQKWDEVQQSYWRSYQKARESGKQPLSPEDIILPRSSFMSLSAKFSDFISTSIVGNNLPVTYVASSVDTKSRKSGDEFLDYIEFLIRDNLDICIYMSQGIHFERLEYALNQRGLIPKYLSSFSDLPPKGTSSRIYLIDHSLTSGFILPEIGLAVISADEMLGAAKRKRLRKASHDILNPFIQLNVGDPVVHRDNGIGIFKGIERLDLDNIKSDFILLEYLGGDKLYVPVYRLGLLQRYIGGSDHLIVDKLGSNRWNKAKTKAKESVKKLAEELIAIYAKRASVKGFSFQAQEDLMKDFVATFPFEETEDQTKAIEDMYNDMISSNPMDRLICGDVGYGKTEVALRAAFMAAISGKQVAVLVPTTLLARQHLASFQQRFEPWPIRVESLSSFSTAETNKLIGQELKKGKIDIIIGTHALLSEKIEFKDLGLLIIDEEHRFGVKHKERIKAMRAQVDILTLTATPIPRTLNMAISGLRDLSIIETPPAERKSIETVISRFDDDAIAQAIQREIARGGQVFFVHNQVKTIDSMSDYIQKLVPQAKVGVTHGQMARVKLNRIMQKFMERSINVLVTSSIISSGLDIPHANTIIINRADKFGLADLYQLRGRVGRSKVKGFALILIPAFGQITKDARKRISAIKEYELLGAGFQMALRDMEIRGVGDILGKAQWGQVTAIGYELYQQMLKEAIDKLQGKIPREQIEPEIRIGIDAYVPEDYCPDQHLRLGLYKRLAVAGYNEAQGIQEELIDLYGPLPQPVNDLLSIAQLRDMMKNLRIKKLDRVENVLKLYPAHDSNLNLQRLVDLITTKNGRLYPSGIAELPIGEDNVLAQAHNILFNLS